MLFTFYMEIHLIGRDVYFQGIGRRVRIRSLTLFLLLRGYKKYQIGTLCSQIIKGL